MLHREHGVSTTGEKAREYAKSVIGRVVASLGIFRDANEDQSLVPGISDTEEYNAFTAYPYENDQLKQLGVSTEHGFPLYPGLNPLEYRELFPSRIDKINTEVKTKVVGYVHYLSGLNDKLSTHSTKGGISFGSSSIETHGFQLMSAAVTTAPDNQKLLEVNLQTGKSINGALKRSFIFRTRNDYEARYLSVKGLEILLKDKRTRIIEAERELTHPKYPGGHRETVRISGNLVSVCLHTASGDEIPLANSRYSDEALGRVLSVNSM